MEETTADVGGRILWRHAVDPGPAGGKQSVLAKNLPPAERSSQDQPGGIQLNRLFVSYHRSGLFGFGWVGDSLLGGSSSDMAARPSGKITATERESSGPVLRLHEQYTRSLAETTPFAHGIFLSEGPSTKFPRILPVVIIRGPFPPFTFIPMTPAAEFRFVN
jgi:hypothetical protein